MIINTYTIELVRSFQIVMMDEGARFLGISSHETCTKQDLPKLVIQDVSPANRQTRNLVSRSVYCLPVDLHSQTFDIGGAFNSSQFSFMGSFRFRDQYQLSRTWNVFSELFPNEGFTSTTSEEGGAAVAQGYAEGSLLRTIA